MSRADPRGRNGVNSGAVRGIRGKTGPGDAAQGTAAEPEDFQSPQEAVLVVEVNAAGAFGIAGGQLFHQGGGAPLAEFFLESGTDVRGRRGRLAQAHDKVGKIKARTPGNHGQGPPHRYIPDRLIGQADKFPGIELLPDVPDVNEVVGKPG
jgi:hypothetical protein